MKARKKRAEIARDDLWKWICGIAAVFALMGLLMAYITQFYIGVYSGPSTSVHGVLESVSPGSSTSRSFSAHIEMYIGGGYYIITQDSFQRTPYGASMTAAELRAYLKARIGADVSLEYVRTSWLDSRCVIGLVVDGVELIDEDAARAGNIEYEALGRRVSMAVALAATAALILTPAIELIRLQRLDRRRARRGR